MNIITTPIIIALLCFVSFNVIAQPACDKDRSCIGRAVQLTETSGRGAHFIEVNGYSIPNKQQTALTVEMWVKVNRVSNTNQF